MTPCRYCGEAVPSRPRMRKYCNYRHQQWHLRGFEAVHTLCTECGQDYVAPSFVLVCGDECRERRRKRHPRVHPPNCEVCGKVKHNKYRKLCNICFEQFLDVFLRRRNLNG